MTVRILIADDHPFILSALATLFGCCDPLRVVGQASSPDEVWALLQALPVDLLVTDLNMAGQHMADGLHMIQLIRRRWPRLRIVIHTQVGSYPILSAAVRTGALGLVHKSNAQDELIPAVESAAKGAVYHSAFVRNLLATSLEAELSEREADVLRLFGQGITLGEIARQLNRSAKTISEHKVNAMAKLGLKNDLELYLYARRNDLST